MELASPTSGDDFTRQGTVSPKEPSKSMEEVMEDAMQKRLHEARDHHFKLKSLIEADNRFSKRQTAITVQKGS